MKTLNFSVDTTIFLLRNINCHTRIQSIKKSHEITSSSKTNFSKIQALWAGVYDNRIYKTGKMIWSQLLINFIIRVKLSLSIFYQKALWLTSFLRYFKATASLLL